MMNFCTLYDSNYISKGLALYLSIAKYTDDFTMYVMAMDRKCQEMLNALAFKHVVVDCIEDIDDPKLAEAKGNRSRAEFCWTCGSYTTDYFLHKYDLPDITYLDSDLMFFCSPQVVFDELQNKNASVGLAPHFTKYPWTGKYCVQYVYFKNDDDGRKCLRWWRDECLKWCYSRVEDGKYGDQKYLDYFAEKFGNVYDIENRGVGMAYWNLKYYSISDHKVIYEHQEWPQVFFHYSGFNVKVEEKVIFFRHTMYLTPKSKKSFVEPYAELLKDVFTKYLITSIEKIEIVPLSNWKYPVKALSYYLNKILPMDWLIVHAMKIKYRESHKPYSERG